jgi:hypothetical protein
MGYDDSPPLPRAEVYIYVWLRSIESPQWADFHVTTGASLGS